MKWCDRCNRYHNEEPVDPSKIAENHAEDMAQEIDRLVLASAIMSDKGYQTAPLTAAMKCYCYNCADPYKRMTTFIVCPTCGNKRCPHATDHNLECTNSNEPNQPGSRY